MKATLIELEGQEDHLWQIHRIMWPDEAEVS